MKKLQLLAPRDVASRLGVTTSRVVQLDRERKLVALRDASGRRFYLAKDVEQFAAARELRRSIDERRRTGDGQGLSDTAGSSAR